MKKTPFPLLKLSLLSVLIIGQAKAQTGTWTALTNQAPDQSQGVMVLMTDGTVLCQDASGGNYGTGWDKLTPDATGSYINGTWSRIASMNNDRLFFSSQVLPSGKLYVGGGEYQTNYSTGEVYDPVANTWTLCGAVPNGYTLYDSPSELLYTGNVLTGPELGGHNSTGIFQWSPTTLAYTNETAAPLNHDETAWLKLQDSTVLYVGIGSNNSNRFQPKTNTWLTDANTPNNMYDTYGDEAGCALNLPNGKAIFFGSTKYNNIYTPSGNSRTAGTWAAAADMPTISGTLVGQVDAPGAMMVNGHILLGVSPENSSNNDQFRAPIWYIEYDYTTNTFTQVTSVIPGLSADSVAGVPCNFTVFLDLPDGGVLMAINQEGSTQYWEYTPGSGPIAEGKPTLNSVTEISCGTYRATGKLFNGISEGASFGDDWQMATNYPLIRITNGTNTYYAKTTNWNRLGAIQTDSLEDTCNFTLPSVPAGTYSLVVVVNGFASNPTLFTPFAATASASSNVLCHGGTDGNATANVGGGSSPYTYKWSNGSSTVSTANPTGPILSAGTYTLTVTDHLGCSVTSTITITQPNALTIATTVKGITCNGLTDGSATATPSGGTSPYTYAWSGGGTSATKSGLSLGTYTITVTDKNGCTASAITAAITQPAVLTATTNAVANAACFGKADGSVSATPAGGTAPYTYAWSGGGTKANKSGISAGTYTVTITDKNGCSTTSSVTITQPATAISVTSGAYATLSGNCVGTAFVTASGGTPGYKYSWSPSGGTSDTARNLCVGNYCCTVTDANGCVDSVCVSVVTGIQGINNASNIRVYPDPNNGVFFIESAIAYNKATVEIDNVLGQVVLSAQLNGSKNKLNLAEQPSGVYVYRVFSATGTLLGNGKIVIQK